MIECTVMNNLRADGKEIKEDDLFACGSLDDYEDSEYSSTQNSDINHTEHLQNEMKPASLKVDKVSESQPSKGITFNIFAENVILGSSDGFVKEQDGSSLLKTEERASVVKDVSKELKIPADQRDDGQLVTTCTKLPGKERVEEDGCQRYVISSLNTSDRNLEFACKNSIGIEFSRPECISHQLQNNTSNGIYIKAEIQDVISLRDDSLKDEAVTEDNEIETDDHRNVFANNMHTRKIYSEVQSEPKLPVNGTTENGKLSFIERDNKIEGVNMEPFLNKRKEKSTPLQGKKRSNEISKKNVSYGQLKSTDQTKCFPLISNGKVNTSKAVLHRNVSDTFPLRHDSSADRNLKHKETQQAAKIDINHQTGFPLEAKLATRKSNEEMNKYQIVTPDIETTPNANTVLSNIQCYSSSGIKRKGRNKVQTKEGRHSMNRRQRSIDKGLQDTSDNIDQDSEPFMEKENDSSIEDKGDIPVQQMYAANALKVADHITNLTKDNSQLMYQIHAHAVSHLTTLAIECFPGK